MLSLRHFGTTNIWRFIRTLRICKLENMREDDDKKNLAWVASMKKTKETWPAQKMISKLQPVIYFNELLRSNRVHTGTAMENMGGFIKEATNFVDRVGDACAISRKSKKIIIKTLGLSLVSLVLAGNLPLDPENFLKDGSTYRHIFISFNHNWYVTLN